MFCNLSRRRKIVKHQRIPWMTSSQMMKRSMVKEVRFIDIWKYLSIDRCSYIHSKILKAVVLFIQLYILTDIG